MQATASLLYFGILCVHLGYGGVTLEKHIDDSTKFSLRCVKNNIVYRAYLYWRLNDHTALKTFRWWFPKYQYVSYVNKELKDITYLSTSRKSHSITVTKTSNQTMVWKCCQSKGPWRGQECSNVVTIDGTGDRGNTSTGVTDAIPEKEFKYENGNLTLVSSDNDMNDELVKLTCGIDQPLINQSNWLVEWFIDDAPILVTFKNSLWFLDDATQFQNNITFSLLTQNLTIESTETTPNDHTITFKTSLIGTSSWTCRNPFLQKPSNVVNVTIDASVQEANNETTQTTTQANVDASLLNGGESTQSTPIIAGTVCGVIVVGILVVTIVVIFWRRHKQGKEISKASRKGDDLVTAENVLYVTGKEESQIINRNDNDEKVVQENVLYVGGNDIDGF